MRAFRLAPLALAFVACTTATPDELVDDDSLTVVEDGKEDNYFSTTGKEFDITGQDAITVEAGAGRARAEALVPLRFKALSWFIYQYVTTKEHEESNVNYGGFNALVRQGSFDESSLTAAGTDRFTFTFTAEIAGPAKLLSGKWIRKVSGKQVFDLKLPKLSNAELESGSYAKTYKTFDPATLSADKLETLTLGIAASKASVDAYPNYTELFADGKLDIAIHVGGDYNESRHDLAAAKSIFSQLKASGFTAPVSKIEDVNLETAPFKKTIKTPKGNVAVEVYLYWPDMNGTNYASLVDAYKKSAKTRDIVVYDGHAGYDSDYSGVVVKYNPRVALAATEFASLDLPSKYQLFLFNGCKTYGMYPDQLYRNPTKTPANLDVMSTVNFSWLSEMPRITGELVDGLSKVSGTAGHFPLTYGQLLGQMNKGQSSDVLYGVHGLDDNPHGSPWFDAAIAGKKCTAQSQCGSADTACVKPSGASCKVCAPACTDDAGCPSGSKCKAVASTSTNTLAGRQCIPTRPTCR